jgi:hypothetical protein
VEHGTSAKARGQHSQSVRMLRVANKHGCGSYLGEGWPRAEAKWISIRESGLHNQTLGLDRGAEAKGQEVFRWCALIRLMHRSVRVGWVLLPYELSLSLATGHMPGVFHSLRQAPPAPSSSPLRLTQSSLGHVFDRFSLDRVWQPPV